MICPYMSGKNFDFRKCQEKDCELYDKDTEECNETLKRKALEEIASAIKTLAQQISVR